MAKQLKPTVEFNLGEPVKQFRFVPIAPAPGERAFLAVHSSCAGVDPYHRMFFLPTDTLKLTAFTAAGEVLWRRDLGPGVIPGTWFCPVLAFDLDDNGVDDIWLVGNNDPDHAMDFETYQLERMSAATGKELYSLAGAPAFGGKILDAPGEQIVTSDSDGTVRIYTCPDAEDTPAAKARYANPYYAACLRIWAMASSRVNLGGL